MGIRTSLHTEGQPVDLNHRQPGFLCLPCTIRTRIPVVCTFQFRLRRYCAPLRRFSCAWLPYKHSCPGMLRFSVLSLLLTADGGRSSFSRMISPVLPSRYERIVLIVQIPAVQNTVLFPRPGFHPRIPLLCMRLPPGLSCSKSEMTHRLYGTVLEFYYQT